LRAIVPRVDLGQHVALFDARAVGESDGHDSAADFTLDHLFLAFDKTGEGERSGVMRLLIPPRSTTG
jgi:hypothetical protein